MRVVRRRELRVLARGCGWRASECGCRGGGRWGRRRGGRWRRSRGGRRGRAAGPRRVAVHVRALAARVPGAPGASPAHARSLRRRGPPAPPLQIRVAEARLRVDRRRLPEEDAGPVAGDHVLGRRGVLAFLNTLRRASPPIDVRVLLV